MTIEELKEMSDVIVVEAIKKHYGKPHRLEEATAEYVDSMFSAIGHALVGHD